MSKADKDMMSDAMLDDLFRAARAEAPVPSADLLARIMGDADTELAARPAVLPVRAAPRLKTRLRAFIDGLGGWTALAGMVTAAVVGVSMGFVSPDQVNTLSGGLLLQSDTTTTSSYDLEDIVPGFSGLSAIGAEG
jgi:hypothetical protein